MDVRPYRPDDLPTVARLFTESVRHLGAVYYDEAQLRAWAPSPPDLDRWRRRLAPLCTLVADLDGALAGFVAFGGDGHIALLYTSPAHARRGVGSALYGRAEDSLSARGVAELFTEASLPARPFFLRHGFVVVEEQHVARGGATLRRFAMRKRIGES